MTGTVQGDTGAEGRIGFAIDGLDRCTIEHRAGPRDEVWSAARWLIERRQDGCEWRDMALVVPGKRKWRDPVIAVLDALAIPHRLLVGHPGAVPDFDDDVVHAMSLYTAADDATPVVVAIVGLGDLPWKQQSIDEAVAVVGRTVGQATRAVRLSWSRDSALTARLDLSSTSRERGARTPG